MNGGNSLCEATRFLPLWSWLGHVQVQVLGFCADNWNGKHRTRIAKTEAEASRTRKGAMTECDQEAVAQGKLKS